MKYLCLIYQDENKVNVMSSGEYDALCEEALAYEEELRSCGHLIAAEPLQTTQSATLVRVQKGGHISITDGPFAETKEQLAGFFLIEAGDLNDAIRIASKIPPARLGSVEVRPIRDLARKSNADAVKGE